MPGIRIRHPNQTLWGQTVLVPHPGDPRTGRKPKDYHLRLDNEGCVIVSTTVWRRLEEARSCGLSPHKFVIVNIVEDPPTQGIGSTPEQPRRMFRQEQDALRELAPMGINPRIERHVFEPPKQPKPGRDRPPKKASS